jgi:hypothetical protein
MVRKLKNGEEMRPPAPRNRALQKHAAVSRRVAGAHKEPCPRGFSRNVARFFSYIMDLTPEQKQAIVTWVAAGDNLSAIQKKLTEQFKLSLTYMDVRFLVDDLDLQLKESAPQASAADIAKATGGAGAGQTANNPGNRTGPSPASADQPDAAIEEDFADDADPAEDAEAPPAGGGNVRIDVDKVTLLPGAIASGGVTFSDGVTAKWIVDNYGRPGFTEVSQPGYRPSPADGQAFMQQLSAALQRHGY